MNYKTCKYCGDRTRIKDGGKYIVCSCYNSITEQNLQIDKQQLQKRIVDISKEISELQTKYSKSAKEDTMENKQ